MSGPMTGDVAARLAWRFGAMAAAAGRPMVGSCPFGPDQAKMRTAWGMGYSAAAA